MSVLIKGMSFPTKENFMTQLYLIYDKDGNGYAVDTTNKALYKLIEVKEPHGRLIDGDELKTAFPECDNSMDVKIASVRATISHAPTVIEAEGRE